MIKPAYKTLEGQSLGAVILGGLALIQGQETFKGVPTEDILKYAATAKDIAVAWHVNGINDLVPFVGLGKTGLILFFMYKMYIKFLESRTDLKKKVLEAESTQTQQ
jgi:hypothetical protein